MPGGVFAGGRGSGFSAASYTSADGYRAHSDGDILRGQVAFDYVAGPGTRVAIQANGSRLDSRLPGSQSQPQFDADPDAAAPAALTFGFGRGGQSLPWWGAPGTGRWATGSRAGTSSTAGAPSTFPSDRRS